MGLTCAFCCFRSATLMASCVRFAGRCCLTSPPSMTTTPPRIHHQARRASSLVMFVRSGLAAKRIFDATLVWRMRQTTHRAVPSPVTYVTRRSHGRTISKPTSRPSMRHTKLLLIPVLVLCAEQGESSENGNVCDEKLTCDNVLMKHSLNKTHQKVDYVSWKT